MEQILLIPDKKGPDRVRASLGLLRRAAPSVGWSCQLQQAGQRKGREGMCDSVVTQPGTLIYIHSCVAVGPQEPGRHCEVAKGSERYIAECLRGYSLCYYFPENKT